MAKVTKRPHAALDIGFHDDPDVLAAGNAAIGLYARALAYCADKLTDGLVPAAWLCKEGKPAERKRLVELGFLTKTDDGYLIPNYLRYNLSRAAVEEQSEHYRNLVKRRWDKEKEPEPAAEQPGSLDTKRDTHRITGGSTKEGLYVLPDSDSDSDLNPCGAARRESGSGPSEERLAELEEEERQWAITSEKRRRAGRLGGLRKAELRRQRG
jgi:hypothetical protein